MEEKTTVSASATDSIGKLPSFGQLYKESWQLMFSKLGSLLKLFLLSLLGIFLVLVALGVVYFVGGLNGFLQGQFTAVSVIAAVLFLCIYLVGFILVTSLVQISYVKILTSDSKLPIWQTVKESMPLFQPYFTTQLIAGLVILGAFFLFVIPGIIVSIYYFFTQYIVVNENLRGRAALRRSYQLVKPHFWKILCAIMLIAIPSQVIIEILSRYTKDYPQLFLLFIPFSLLQSLFMQSLMVILYKKAKSLAPAAKQVSMRWIKIISIVGYILMLGIFILVFLNGFYQGFTGTDTGSLTLPDIQDK